jgi:ribosomal protein L7/L12
LKDAQDLVESAPCIVVQRVRRQQAERVQQSLRQAGAIAIVTVCTPPT